MADKVIVLTGLKETLNALDAFDKEAKKAFERVINEELGQAKNKARAIVPTTTPMSGWRTTPPKNPRKTTRGGAGWPEWDYDAIRRGIGVSKAERRPTKKYVTSGGAIVNNFSSGAIFEVAGRRSDGNGTGVKFISNLESRFGKASRLIWNVVDEDGDKIRKNIFDALEVAKKKLQAFLNESGS